MSTQEKATGRVKQAAGDSAGDERLRREGVEEERKADARRELHDAQRRAEQKRRKSRSSNTKAARQPERSQAPRKLGASTGRHRLGPPSRRWGHPGH